MNTTTYWSRSRDDHGRSVHYLRRAGCLTSGVVVKHPLKAAGEPGAYWYCRYDLPVDAPREIKVVEFTTLKNAKAALESATR